MTDSMAAAGRSTLTLHRRPNAYKWLLLEAQSLSGWGLGEEGEGALSTLQLGRKYLKWLISR